MGARHRLGESGALATLDLHEMTSFERRHHGPRRNGLNHVHSVGPARVRHWWSLIVEWRGGRTGVDRVLSSRDCGRSVDDRGRLSIVSAFPVWRRRSDSIRDHGAWTDWVRAKRTLPTRRCRPPVTAVAFGGRPAMSGPRSANLLSAVTRLASCRCPRAAKTLRIHVGQQLTGYRRVSARGSATPVRLPIVPQCKADP